MTKNSAAAPVSQDLRVKAVLGAIRGIVENEPPYRDAWRVFQAHNWHERVLAACLDRVEGLIDDYVADSTPEVAGAFYSAIMAAMKDAVVDCIEHRARSMPGPSIAFVAPTRAFSGNFGNVAAELKALGCHVLQLYGYAGALRTRCGPDDFILFDDMIRGVRGVDAMVTASIMDCLPDGTRKILIDHLSFAKFDVDHYLDALWHGDIADDPSGDTGAMFRTFSAYVSFFPLVDLHITPTDFIAGTVDSIARGLGYRDVGGEAAAPARNASFVWRYLRGKPVPDVSTVVVGGYPKLDAVVSRARDVQAENIIVYAPTPNDKSGNKSGAEWADFISVNQFGEGVIQRLCAAFPDHRIVFKPHVDDFEDVIERVTRAGSAYPNFELSMAGSDYWDLYMRTRVLVSDFSSTAYTFAFGTGHPVAFFSPNEGRLGDRREQNAYCRYRREIGEIACDLDGLVRSVQRMIDQQDTYCERVAAFRERHFVNVGCASGQIAKDIKVFLDGDTRLHWTQYQAPDRFD